MTQYQYMVDFSLPELMDDEFMQLIPYQRAIVNRYFEEGKLASYTLSLESGKLWAVFNANNEVEIMDWLADMPLTEFMELDISLLTFHNTSEAEVPNFSLN